MADQEISQAEIWDDSELVNSWNEAFEEYKKYHSLAAKGEKVKLNVDKPVGTAANGDPQSVRTGPEGHDTVTGGARVEDQASANAQQQPVLPSTIAPIAPAFPEAMLSTVSNEDTKNLMMSWYYAGYYTGLYEGKQQGYASAMQRRTD